MNEAQALGDQSGPVRRGQELLQRSRGVDERSASSWAVERSRGGGDERSEHAGTRARAARMLLRSPRTRLEERRIRDHQIGLLRQRARKSACREIALEDRANRARALEVFAQQRREQGLDLDRGELAREPCVVQGEADGAHARAEVDHARGAPEVRRERCEQKGVDVHAIAARGLREHDATAEQRVERRGFAHRDEDRPNGGEKEERSARGCEGPAARDKTHVMLAPRKPKRHERATLRRLAYAGARYGPWFWLRYSPPCFGLLFALVLPGVRRRVRDNLRWVLGQRGFVREGLDVLRTFTNYASCLAEALAAGRPGREPELVVNGEEHLARALAAGRGVVIVTAHTGPWDAVARLLAKRSDEPVLVVMQAEADAAALSFQDEIRARSGVRVLHVGATPFDALDGLRHVRGGGVLAFQLDRPAPSGRGVETGLFGRAFAVPEGPFRLAALARCPLVPVFVARDGFYTYRVEVLAPIEPGPARDTEALVSAARTAAQGLERFIVRHPTQWFHF